MFGTSSGHNIAASSTYLKKGLLHPSFFQNKSIQMAVVNLNLVVLIYLIFCTAPYLKREEAMQLPDIEFEKWQENSNNSN